MNLQIGYPLQFVVLLLLTSCVGRKDLPQIKEAAYELPNRIEISRDFYAVGSDKLLKNEFGIWELYVEGDPYKRGLSNGKLTEELIYKQEKTFVSKIEELVPSKFQQGIVRFFLQFFNRKLDKHVPQEYKEEIYGISKYTSSEFDFVAPIYWRTLYFHAAHDIGHALQDLAMVGCTSFAAWGNHSADGKLILGRNFDFYINEEFSDDKIIAFISPEEGYNHAIVTWAGMVGAVSGMNEKGVTVTINAGKSSIPLVAKTPISLVAREILQYASNLEEAISIAKKRGVFVSESIMVGSAVDGTAILIEVSPKKIDVYQVESQAELLVCSNHFQSKIYQNDKKNLETIANSHSQYRFERMNELVQKNPPITPQIAAEFLRNKEGLKDLKIGYGNEKSINQLVAHHAVIFQPEDRLMWVSANPYQLGSFVAYDLDEVFSEMKNLTEKKSVAIDSLRIPEDEFLYSKEFQNYHLFQRELKQIQKAIDSEEKLEEGRLEEFLALNPEYWLAYFTVGEYYFQRKEYEKALPYYRKALEKEITTIPDKNLIRKRIEKSERKKK